jgi:hypothetical protein
MLTILLEFLASMARIKNNFYFSFLALHFVKSATISARCAVAGCAASQRHVLGFSQFVRQ